MWTEKSLKEKIIENKSFTLDAALTELLPLALDITEDSKKIPYAFTQIHSDPVSRVEVRAFSPEDSPNGLTVQNYHAMLKYLKEEFDKRPEHVQDQKNHGFKLMIDFDNGGSPTHDLVNLFRIYASVHHDAYCLSLSCGSHGYRAFSGPSKIRMAMRCEDFLGPNRHTFT